MSYFHLLSKSQINFVEEHCEDVRAICQPLFDISSINSFIYCRFYDSGTCVTLDTNHGVLENHYKKAHLVNPPLPQQLIKKNFNFLITPNVSYNTVVAEARELFNMDHMMYSFDRCPGYYDMFVFGAKSEHELVINFYLNHSDVIEKFKLFFKEQAKKLLNQAAKNKIIVPQEMQGTISSLSEEELLDNDIDKFMYWLNKNRILHDKYGIPVKLTQREHDCLAFLIKGLSPKEVAYNLKLSLRTVESYLDKIKSKLGCYSIKDLIKYSLDQKLF